MLTLRIQLVNDIETRKARGEEIPLLDLEELKMLDTIRNDFKELEENKKKLERETAELNAALTAAANYAGIPNL